MKGSFHTGLIAGTAKARPKNYSIPYDGGWHPSRPEAPPADKVLEGAAIKAKCDAWVAAGIIEADAAEALSWTADYFQKGHDLRGVYVVMIGAGSAMGPLPKLLEMGATIVAIDIPGSWGKGTKRPTSAVWKRLCEQAENSAGSLVIPLSKPQSKCADADDLYESAGCDLMKQPAEIANWLVEWQV